MILLVLGDGE